MCAAAVLSNYQIVFFIVIGALGAEFLRVVVGAVLDAVKRGRR